MDPINLDHAIYLTSLKPGGVTHNKLVLESSTKKSANNGSPDEVISVPTAVLRQVWWSQKYYWTAFGFAGAFLYQ